MVVQTPLLVVVDTASHWDGATNVLPAKIETKKLRMEGAPAKLSTCVTKRGA